MAPIQLEPPPQEWIFTFGSGQRAHAIPASTRTVEAEQGKGIRLSNRYVIIHGTFETARQRMVEVFGQVWCGQYATRDAAGVDEYKLTELVITDD